MIAMDVWSQLAVVVGLVVGMLTIIGLVWRAGRRAEALLGEIRDNTQDIAEIKTNQRAMEGRLIAQSSTEAASMRRKLESELRPIKEQLSHD